jgi:hypothetical protein
MKADLFKIVLDKIYSKLFLEYGHDLTEIILICMLISNYSRGTVWEVFKKKLPYKI